MTTSNLSKVAPWLKQWITYQKNFKPKNNNSDDIEYNDVNVLERLCALVISDTEDDEDKFIQEAFVLALASSPKLKMSDLKASNIPSEILSLENDSYSNSDVPLGCITNLLLEMPNCRKYPKLYSRSFAKMIHLEEVAQSHFISLFNTRNISLEYTDSPREFKIKRNESTAFMADGIEESIIDNFTLRAVFTLEEIMYSKFKPNVSICGQIKTTNKEFIFVEINDRRHAEHIRRNYNRKFDIFFQLNVFAFQLQHNALRWIHKHNLFNILINNPKYDSVDIEDYCSHAERDYYFSGKLASQLNEEQKNAAKNIIRARNMPVPYILFGPAGTGKTRTLCAAIEEIVRSTSKYILVCANSNAACDEIAERLIDVLHFGEMFRMYAKSHDARKICEKLKPISNCSNKFEVPSLKFLYNFRVLVCTLTTAGCLVRANNDPHFDRNHFSYVIIDESASTQETVTMIPIAGLCTSHGEINASIVLAGDPKQLDVVTKSQFAASLGFKTSFMEYLFNKPLYKRHPVTDTYNETYITQLVKNYRSHPAILHIPNMLFYDNKLEAKAPGGITDWFIGSKLLPSKQFPIIFKSVQGFCKKSDKDFSLFNQKEVTTVMEYITKLLGKNGLSKTPITQFDIGVVTPYKLQCKVIARECRRNGFNNVTIGTAEVFQGQERPIMIVSTVRTGGKLGFVNDPRRLNVIITRAKCLLIVVGDHKTLYLDENWKKFIDHCLENGAVIS